MEDLQDLFPGNGKWQEIMSRLFNNTFKQRIEKHQPKYMWIGCSDSRVPANEMIGVDPCMVFVHRNVANQVHLQTSTASQPYTMRFMFWVWSISLLLVTTTVEAFMQQCPLNTLVLLITGFGVFVGFM